MQKWVKLKIGDIFDTIRGNGLSKDSIDKNGKYECILYGELFTKYKEIIKQVVSKTDIDKGVNSISGDLLLPGSTTTNAEDLAICSVVNKDNVKLGGDINILRNKNTYDIDSNYMAYYLTNMKKREISAKAQGTTIVHLYAKDLKDIEIELPTIEEQKRIAKILLNVDNIIEKLKNEIKEEKKHSQSLIKKLLNNTEFEEKKMKDIVEYKKGYAFISKEYTKKGRRIIRVSDLTETSIKDRTAEAIYINEEQTHNYKDWILHENDIIITTVGSKPPIYNSMAGKVIIVPKEEEGSLLNQNNVRIRVKKGVLQLYLYYYLKQHRYINYIECIMRGNANQGNITINELLEYNIRFPSIENQKKIINVLNKIEKKIEMLQKNIKEYQNLKKGLMQQLLTGKVRVKI